MPIQMIGFTLAMSVIVKEITQVTPSLNAKQNRGQLNTSDQNNIQAHMEKPAKLMFKLFLLPAHSAPCSQGKGPESAKHPIYNPPYLATFYGLSIERWAHTSNLHNKKNTKEKGPNKEPIPRT